jgi:hypothetical protein
VDYTNVEQLIKTLEENNIHTVISTIVMYDPAAAAAERNFITASDKSSCTKRFVASNWGNATPEDPYVLPPLFPFPLLPNYYQDLRY